MLRLLQLDPALLSIISIILIKRVARILLLLLLRRTVRRGGGAVLALVRVVAVGLVGVGFVAGEPAGAVGGGEARAAAAAGLDAAGGG